MQHWELRIGLLCGSIYALYRTVPYCTVLYRTVPYCTVLYRTVPYTVQSGVQSGVLGEFVPDVVVEVLPVHDVDTAEPTGEGLLHTRQHNLRVYLI